jgi:diguanylate cyclase (GGDEF)-like protein/PAS domain S-box-containing protein
LNIDDAFYRDLIENLQEGVYFVDRDRKIRYWNRGAERITGFKSAEVLGKYCWHSIVMHRDEQGNDLCEIGRCPMVRAIIEERIFSADMSIAHKDGHRISITTRIMPMRDSEGHVMGAAEVFSDKSSSMDKLEKFVLLDPVTELANKRLATMNLTMRLSERKRHDLPFGVILADIDKFKKINEEYGHDTACDVLKAVGKTLQSCLRTFDVVARWDGGKFLVIIVHADRDQLFFIANRLHMLVKELSIFAANGILRVTISVGATFADPADTVEKLLERASGLLEQSKTAGGDSVSTA